MRSKIEFYSYRWVEPKEVFEFTDIGGQMKLSVLSSTRYE